ncbi:MAG: hypothetical protein A4S16_01840 [Proteobacteria bacterium SG_bin6]|nr:MAG: hypothetical protein A4S16_01840 [Proteobacteria bacterium SG_bin6]
MNLFTGEYQPNATTCCGGHAPTPNVQGNWLTRRRVGWRQPRIPDLSNNLESRIVDIAAHVGAQWRDRDIFWCIHIEPISLFPRCVEALAMAAYVSICEAFARGFDGEQQPSIAVGFGHQSGECRFVVIDNANVRDQQRLPPLLLPYAAALGAVASRKLRDKRTCTRLEFLMGSHQADRGAWSGEASPDNLG